MMRQRPGIAESWQELGFLLAEIVVGLLKGVVAALTLVLLGALVLKYFTLS